MLSFKQFLLEGGKATADLGTVRATKEDIKAALTFISKATGLSENDLHDSLLGSTTHTLKGIKKDSGDIDIAIHDTQSKVVDDLAKVLRQQPVKIGSNTFSFAVPGADNRKVQVDFMLVPSKDWAKWMYHADENSKHKGKIRNALLRAVAAHHIEDGKDMVIKDKEGNTVVRVRKSLKNEEGLVRLHKVALPRKNGKGRVKSLSDATQQQIEDAIREYGKDPSKISMDRDQILDPDKVAEILFGKGVSSKDLMSTEQVVSLILKMPKEDISKIVNSAIGGEMGLSEVPNELKPFVKK